MRLPDWESRFAELVTAVQGARFAWGKFDCCTFAADAVQAVRGDDPLAPVRGSYADLRSAWKLITERGGLREAVAGVLGAPMENAACAGRGDIVLVNVDRYPALGVVIGQSALAPLSIGLQRVAMRDWIAAWKVD
jgi:hypothetical protein